MAVEALYGFMHGVAIYVSRQYTHLSRWRAHQIFYTTYVIQNEEQSIQII